MLESKDIAGKISVSWETYTVVELDPLQNRCTGCLDLFYIGEVVAQIVLNKHVLRFNHSCIQQLAMVLSTFLEATENANSGVIVRHN